MSDDANDTPEFYSSRERQERELAAAATDIAVSRIHLELAESYLEQGREAERKRQAREHRQPE